MHLLWLLGCGISLGLFLIPALPPTAAAFQDHCLDLKKQWVGETRSSALQTLSSAEGGRRQHSDKAVSSTKGNRRGQSANKSALPHYQVYENRRHGTVG